MDEQTNPATGVEQASPEDRILSILGREDKPEAETPDAPIEQAQPEVQADGELTEADLPADEDPPPQTAEVEFEIVVGGETRKVASRAEQIELMQKGADYTKKTQELAQEKHQVQEQIRQLTQIQQANPYLEQARAKVIGIGAELQQFQSLDWMKVAEDFVEFPKYQARYQALQMQYNAAAQEYNQIEQTVSQAAQQLAAQRLQSEAARLPDVVPVFKDPAKAAAATEDMRRWLKAHGVAEQNVSRYLDSAISMKALYQASQYEKLMQGKADKVKQVRTAPPVPRPGSATQGTERADRDREMRQKLGRSGSAQDAIALIANRLK